MHRLSAYPLCSKEDPHGISKLLIHVMSYHTTVIGSSS